MTTKRLPIENSHVESSSIERLEQGLVEKVREKFVVRLDKEDHDSVVEEARIYIEDIVRHKRRLSTQLKDDVCNSVLDECFGLGPLGALLRRPDVGDIYLEGWQSAYIEVAHHLKPVSLPFEDDKHVLAVIHKLIRPLGGELTQHSPMFSGTLPNGCKVYASIPPVSPHGPTLSVVCRQQSTIELIPCWLATCRYVSALPLVEHQQNHIDENIVRIQLSENISDVYLHQSFPARSFRGKTIRFSGLVRLLEPLEDANSRRDVIRCISAYVEATDRYKKRSTEQREIVLLEQDAQFECGLLVPERAVRISVGLHVRGPMTISISGLNFGLGSNRRKPSRIPLGPRNLSLDKLV
jgi:hypothetical protein